MLRTRYDDSGLGKAMLEIFERAELCHVRTALGETLKTPAVALEPASFTVTPEALSLVRAIAQVSGKSQGEIVSEGIELAAEILCRREGVEFRVVVEKRQAKILAALGGPSAAAPAAEK